MVEDKAISNGPNARPRDANIGTTSSGLPNDSSRPVEISDEEEARLAESLKRRPTPDMPYDVAHVGTLPSHAPAADVVGQQESTETDEGLDEAFKQGEQELGDRLSER